MAMQKREMVLLGVMLALLAGAGAWCYGWMSEQRQAARAAATDLAQCRMHADAITNMGGKKKGSSDEATGEMELGKRVEAALAAARINPNSLDGVFSQPARAVGNSPYLLQPTTLPLRSVSLGQVAAFLYHLTDGTSLSVRDLRLTVPRGEASRSVWDAEATVTCLVSAPPKKTSR